MTDSKCAFVFPGQGSQKVGMLADLYNEYVLVQETFKSASSVLGYDLWSLVQEGSQEDLNMTEKTQPALLASSVAIWRVWNQLEGVQPNFMAGHSLGEWSALVCAEVVSFESAIRLVQLRGQYMQTAVPAGEGAMAAIIGLDDAAVESACHQASSIGIASAVNYNSPAQLVIAGEAEAIKKAMQLCKDAGAKRALPLPVSAPFHTHMMKPAAKKLALEIAQTEFMPPKIPVIHNVTAASEIDPNKIKDLMVEQIYSPVRWVDCIKTLMQKNVTKTIECGPGKVLSGLNRRIDKTLESLATETHSLLLESIEQIKN